MRTLECLNPLEARCTGAFRPALPQKCLSFAPLGCQARPASCLASASEPARPTFRLGRELVDKAKPHLNHRLEH